MLWFKPVEPFFGESCIKWSTYGIFITYSELLLFYRQVDFVYLKVSLFALYYFFPLLPLCIFSLFTFFKPAFYKVSRVSDGPFFCLLIILFCFVPYYFKTFWHYLPCFCKLVAFSTGAIISRLLEIVEIGSLLIWTLTNTYR